MTTPVEVEPAKPVAPAFLKFINDYGLTRIAVYCGVSAEAVRKWHQYARGLPNGRVPRPKYIRKLVQLGRGRLDAGDILMGVGRTPTPAPK